jgi:hypothetical protein
VYFRYCLLERKKVFVDIFYGYLSGNIAWRLEQAHTAARVHEKIHASFTFFLCTFMSLVVRVLGHEIVMRSINRELKAFGIFLWKLRSFIIWALVKLF